MADSELELQDAISPNHQSRAEHADGGGSDAAQIFHFPVSNAVVTAATTCFGSVPSFDSTYVTSEFRTAFTCHPTVPDVNTTTGRLLNRSSLRTSLSHCTPLTFGIA